MGPLADGGQALHFKDGMSMDDIAPKPDLNHNHNHNHEGSCSSSVSTPEPDGEAVAQDASQRQKRKGGRKPIYATSEERKQRNRQAQAAFRERRTEYIKQLESTIKINEETLQTLQQSHRSAADECLMLRYKNSLLERILLEKGIDVQAELRLKSGSPSMPPARLATQVNNPSPLSRPPMTQPPPNRAAGIAPKLETVRGSHIHRDVTYGVQSPQLQPTPPSHASSPSAAKSPGYPLQGMMSPATTDIHAQPQQQQQPPPPQHTLAPYQRSQLLNQQGSYVPGLAVMTPSSTADATDPSCQSRSVASNSPHNQSRVPTHYLSPFQKHYDQLDQEYETQADMVEEDAEPDVEITSYHSYRPQSSYSHAPTRTERSSIHGHSSEMSGIETTNPFLDHFDPMLDADPFGLTASMHFPTPFSYTQNQTRS